MHGHRHRRVPLLLPRRVQVLRAVGCVPLAGQRRADGEEDCVRGWARGVVCQRRAVRACQREVCLREGAAKVEAFAGEYRGALGDVVWVRDDHDGGKFLDCLRGADFQLSVVVGGQYCVCAARVGAAGVVVDLRPCGLLQGKSVEEDAVWAAYCADLDLGVLDYWGDVRGYRADHGRVSRRVH